MKKKAEMERLSALAPRLEPLRSPYLTVGEEPVPSAEPVRLLFTLAAFLGSFLLFLVEPMAAKAILPRFGGAPAVWNAALLFFQVALLLGYAWAHRAGRSRILHPALLAVAALSLLALPAARLLLPPEILPPAIGVALSLGALVGLPFLALAAGAPVLQRWFARTGDPLAQDPYFLYAASNVGSLGALLAYPFLVEPRFGLTDSFRFWSLGVAALVPVVMLCARAARGEEPSAPPPAEAVSPWRWVLLAAVPSSLLMGVTGFVTSNVAPLPLLWVVPLALYLVTFVLAFSGRVRVSGAALGRFFPLLAAPLAILVMLESTEPRGPVAAIHGVVFFLACWMCHRLLAEARPPAGGLTRYYLWVSVGGALGGAFNALLAPALFPTLFEYPLALCAALALRPAIKLASARRDLVAALAIAGLAVVTILVALRQEPGPLRTALSVGVPVVVAFWTMDFPRRFAGALFGIFLAAAVLGPASSGRIVHSERSFFGVHRVIERGRLRELVHGATTHGIQDRDHPEIPLTYYHPTGPAGQVFLQRPSQARSVALVGLGVGSLAAYGRPGDRFDLFEIDPSVVHIANDPRLFTFLRDSKATLRTVVGDARLTLAREAPATYDLIVLDAFTSDSVPVHLLTVEAMRMYQARLKPGGLLLMHVSNRFLDLPPVVNGAGRITGWTVTLQDDGTTDEQLAAGKTQSRWMAMAATPEALAVWCGKDWGTEDVARAPEPWTDDRSDLLSRLKASGD